MDHHKAAMDAAIAAEGKAHRLLLAGEDARAPLLEAADSYRASWEAAGPTAYGRLIGMLKAAVLAGEAEGAAAYVRGEVGAVSSPTAAYALALAALVDGDDEGAGRAAEAMRTGGEAFERAADAITALAARDAAGYSSAIEAVVADFAARPAHLTGVPIADTALVLERLAAPRGLRSGVVSPLLPRW